VKLFPTINTARSRKKTTLWNIVFQYTNILVGVVRGFLLVPLYLLYIEIELYGAWLASGNILMWITITDPGVGNILQQQVAVCYGNKNKQKLGESITSGIISGFIIGLLVLLIGLIVSNLLFKILNLQHTQLLAPLQVAFDLGIIGSAFMIFSYALYGINSGLQSSKAIGSIDLITNLISITIVIVLLLYGYGVLALGYSLLAKGVFSLVANLSYLAYRMFKEKITLIFSIKHFASFTKLFLYTFLSKALTTLAANLDLVLITRWIGPEIVTVFELTRRPIKLMATFADRPSVSILPTFSNLFGFGDFLKLKKVFILFLYFWIWLMILIIGGLIAFNGSLIMLWIGEEFYLGDKLNTLLCISLFVTSFTHSMFNFSYSLGNIKGNSIAEGIGSSLWIIMMFVLGSQFGLIGFVISPLLAKLLYELWYYPLFLKRTIKLEMVDMKKIAFDFFKIAIVVLLMIIVVSKIDVNSWLFLISIVGIFVVVYLLLLSTISSKFREQTISIIKHRNFKL
jgi:O-antigen/teichoic acid export membrane protein